MLLLNMVLFIAAVIKNEPELMATSMLMWLLFLAAGYIVLRKFKKEQVQVENKESTSQQQ